MRKVDDYQDECWHPDAISKIPDIAKALKLQQYKPDLWKVMMHHICDLKH